MIVERQTVYSQYDADTLARKGWKHVGGHIHREITAAGVWASKQTEWHLTRSEFDWSSFYIGCMSGGASVAVLMTLILLWSR